MWLFASKNKRIPKKEHLRWGICYGFCVRNRTSQKHIDLNDRKITVCHTSAD